MKAWLLDAVYNLNKESKPLTLVEIERPAPGPHEILIRVVCCGVCHTELDEIEGRTPPPSYPVTPGHQVVGIVEFAGAGAERFNRGDRVGVAWIFSACGQCTFCLGGQENLCEHFRGTGRDANGGYAEFMAISEDFAYAIPPGLEDTQAAPLLCAGAIGYRALRLTNLMDGQTLGLSGFGASGHLVLKITKHLLPRSRVLVFARRREEQEFARSLGAAWAGAFTDTPPEKALAIIDTTPAWKPVVHAMDNLAPGGRLVINAIRKESADQNELMSLSYHDHLWMEKEIKSVANITRQDVSGFLEMCSKWGLKPDTQTFPFEKANEAIMAVKTGKGTGAKVLMVG